MDADDRALATDAWIDLHAPDLGIDLRIPPGLHPVPYRDGDRRGVILTSAPGEWPQTLVLTFLPGIPGEDPGAAWQAEAMRLADAPDRISAGEAGAYPATVDGVRGWEGWLRFRDTDGEELRGLLWVGEVGAERAVVAYWCAAWEGAERSRWFAGRYRWIMASLRWVAMERAEDEETGAEGAAG